MNIKRILITSAVSSLVVVGFMNVDYGSKKQPVSMSQYYRPCELAIKNQAYKADSVNLHYLFNPNLIELPTHEKVFISTFDAITPLGVELTHNVSCRFKNGKLVSHRVW